MPETTFEELHQRPSSKSAVAGSTPPEKTTSKCVGLTEGLPDSMSNKKRNTHTQISSAPKLVMFSNWASLWNHSKRQFQKEVHPKRLASFGFLFENGGHAKVKLLGARAAVI